MYAIWIENSTAEGKGGHGGMGKPFLPLEAQIIGQKSPPELEVWIGKDHLVGSGEGKKYSVGFRATTAAQVLRLPLHYIQPPDGWHQDGFRQTLMMMLHWGEGKELLLRLGRLPARQGLHSNIFLKGLGPYSFFTVGILFWVCECCQHKHNIFLFLAQTEEARTTYDLNYLATVRNLRYLLLNY